MDIMVKKIDLLEVQQRFVSHYYYGLFKLKIFCLNPKIYLNATIYEGS